MVIDSVFSAVTALVVGITSTKAFDYYWKVYKAKSDTGANGALVAKDETIQLLRTQQDSLLRDLEELRDIYVDLKMEVATLRSENTSMQAKLTELEKTNFELKTVNEILKRK